MRKRESSKGREASQAWLQMEQRWRSRGRHSGKDPEITVPVLAMTEVCDAYCADPGEIILRTWKILIHGIITVVIGSGHHLSSI